MNIDELDSIFASIDTRLRFTRRPDQVPGDLRINWRLASIALVLERCRGRTANLEQIHLLVWSLRSPRSRELIERWFRGEQLPGDVGIRYDPSLTRTILIAEAAEIVTRNTNLTITLTDQGADLASSVWRNADLMTREKTFLTKLPKKISQKAIRELMDRH